MSRAPILVKDLQKGNHVWKMAVRVIDVWTVTEKTGQLHLEMVIQDSKGDQIHVITRHREYKHWTDKITEHQTYSLYNALPITNDTPPKVCGNQHKLLFNSSTTVTQNDMPQIPTHKYNFKSILDFLNGNFNHECLHDVIGCLHEVIRTQRPGNGKKSVANIALSDANGNTVECTLWDDYASQLMNYARPENAVGPNILILTHALCKPNAGEKPALSNAWNGSKLLINHEHPQVEHFRSNLGDYKPSQLPSENMSQRSSTHIPGGHKYWTTCSEFKSIATLIAQKQDCYCTTIGITKSIKPSKYGWYYECCSSCNATNKDPGTQFHCNCGDPDAVGITKFKVELEVEYNNHNLSFVFWDKECVPILGMTAAALRIIMREANEDNPLIYPEILDKLLMTKFAFRVKYQTLYRQCSIVILNSDQNVYNTIDEFLNPNEQMSKATNQSHALINDVDPVPDSMVSQSNDMIISPQPTMSNHPSWSAECSSTNTPAKRDAPTYESEELPASPFITPKQSATKTKQIKIE